jgi:hypothetical protein
MQSGLVQCSDSVSKRREDACAVQKLRETGTTLWWNFARSALGVRGVFASLSLHPRYCITQGSIIGVSTLQCQSLACQGSGRRFSIRPSARLLAARRAGRARTPVRAARGPGSACRGLPALPSARPTNGTEHMRVDSGECSGGTRLGQFSTRRNI